MKERVQNEVRKLRFLAAEMTQEELAARVGVARQTVIAIEKGKYNPSVALAIRIARVFGLTVEEVFSLPVDGATGDGSDESSGNPPQGQSDPDAPTKDSGTRA
jgi:putative transcriptional regulator